MVKEQPIRTFQPPPTLDELRTWATPRLLRYFKAKREFISRDYYYPYEDMTEEDRTMSDYIDSIRAILNTREHVSR